MRTMSLRGAAVAAAAALLPIIAAALPSPAAAQAEQKVPSIELRGDLSPAQADWIGHALGDAADAGAPFAIVRLDTPGGIDSAAEEIVDQIRSAPIPVVVYVYPGGAEVKDQGASIVDAGRRRRDGTGNDARVRGQRPRREHRAQAGADRA